MSLEGKRDQIAAALSTVPGVTGYPRRPNPQRPGDAWPVYQGAERNDDTGMWVHAFMVGVMLPQDEGQADAWIDGHLEAIGDALARQGVAWADQTDTANFGTDVSPVYGLLIALRSE